jgi:hypothetical protein
VAVLVEGISVILRVDVLRERFPGGWEAFRAAVPNETMCADNEIVRVGFMMPADAEAYVNGLTEYDIRYVVDGKARDLVVADQLHGPMRPCDWAEFGQVKLDGDPKKRVAACRKVGSEEREVVMPLGWKFESSLSASYIYAPTSHTDRSLRFLRHENGVDVYLNELTGEEVFAGRT